MTNHAIIMCKPGMVSKKKLFACIQDINVRRFKGIFTLTGDGKYSALTYGDHLSLEIMLETQQRIELRRYGWGDLPNFVQHVVQEEIAHTFGGICGDEGIDDIWSPDIWKYPTLSSYITAIHDANYMNMLNKEMYDAVVGNIPDDLKFLL